MAYIGNQDYKVIEAHIGSVAGTATAAVIRAKPKVNGQLWIASDTGHLYLSDGTQWQDVGLLQGTQGDMGPQGVSITGVTKTGTAGIVDTYTVTYNNATTSTFEVTNANTWLTGTGIPGTEIGVDNDIYVDTTTSAYYKKVTGIWVMQGSLKGDAFSYDAVGSLAGRAAYNAEATGFGYLVLGSGVPTVYFKLSNVSGNWDTGTAVGKGTGIATIGLTTTVGDTNTYTITYDDGSSSTFNVNDGRGITSVTFASTTDGSGLAGKPGATDTYRISFSNGTTSTFPVINGQDGEVSLVQLNDTLLAAKQTAVAMSIVFGS